MMVNGPDDVYVERKGGSRGWEPQARRGRLATALATKEASRAPATPGLSRDRCPWNVVGRIEKVRGCLFDVSTASLCTLVRRVSIRR